MLGSKKKFKPTNIRVSRKPQEDIQTDTSHILDTPPRSPDMESESINRDERALVTNPNSSELNTSHEREEMDPIFPQSLLQIQTDSSSSPLPDSQFDLDRTSNLSSNSPRRTSGGEELSDEDAGIGESQSSKDPRSKEISSRLKSAKRRKDPQLINLLSRPELFDPDKPLDRNTVTMSQLIRISGIKFRQPNAPKDRPSPLLTPALPSQTQESTTETQPPPKNNAPRVKLVNGKMVVDEDSMLLRTKRQDTSVGTEDVVYESGLEVQGFQRRHKRSYKVRKWSDNENKKLFRALSQFGTDFSIIQTSLLPNRTRAEIKNKFKREERLHPIRVNKALARRIPVMEYVHLEDLNSED